jgi:hypothetical protein
MQKVTILIFFLFSILLFSCGRKNDYSSIELGQYYNPNQGYIITKIYPDGTFRTLVNYKGETTLHKMWGRIDSSLMDSLNKAVYELRNTKLNFYKVNMNTEANDPYSNFALRIKGDGYDCQAFWGDEQNDNVKLKSVRNLMKWIDKIPKDNLKFYADTTHFETLEDLKTKFGE